MKTTIMFFLGLLIATNAAADSTNLKPGDVLEYNYSSSNNPDLFNLEYKSPEEAYAAIANKADVKKFEVGDIVGYADLTTAVLWVFTNDKNPAHPAVMKLKAFESNGNLFMKNSVLCGASKPACDQFVSYQGNLARSVAALYRANKENPNNGLKGGAQKQRAP